MTPLSLTEQTVVHQASAPRARVDWPGRWVGGAIGAVASILVAGLLGLVLRPLDLETYVEDGALGAGALAALLGVPIAFVLGRHFAPIARDGGWGSAAMAALSFGVIAPVLGDLEICGGSLLVPWLTNQRGPEVVAGGIAIFLIGLIVCWVALPVTVLVGFVWVSLMRMLPPTVEIGLRMPPSIARFGTRHLFAALGIWLVVAQVGWALVAPVQP